MNIISRFFIISDLHLYQAEIHEYEGRPIGYEDLLRKRWNHLVKDTDIVIVLGDLNFGKAGQLAPYMNSLKGRKIGVRGNHDKKSLSYYMNAGFDCMADEMKFNDIFGQNIIFSHIPVEVIPEGYINIHGHFHSAQHRETEQYPKEKGYYLYNPEKN